MLTITYLVRNSIRTTALIGILFLEPCILPCCEAQQDDKDKVIEEQRRTIRKLELMIKEREEHIVQVEAAQKRYRMEIKKQIENYQHRNERLLEELRNRSIISRGDNRDVPNIVVPNNDPNPPEVAVNGKVEIVSHDLMQIDVGTDLGVEKDHTLEVYRLTPSPKYLGRARVIDCNTDKAVCRLLTGPDGKRMPIQVGDRVTSRFDAISNSRNASYSRRFGARNLPCER